MLFTRKLKQFAQKFAPVITLGVMALIGGLTANAGQGPVFNDPTVDPNATLRVRRFDGTPFKTSLTDVTPGEQLEMLVWVHNTTPDTIANNATVKVQLPSNLSATHFPVASISATNAETVSGQVVMSGSAITKLSYVQGSAVLMKNINNTMTPVSWAAGQNPDNIVTTGVNLKDINGCWQYVQAIQITVQAEGGTPSITTNKKVGLAGGAPFSDAVTASPNDAVEYRIYVENTGTATALNPTIVDTLDAHTKYVPGTSFARVKQNNNDYDQPIPDSNIVVENLADGRQRLTYYFVDMAARPDTAFYLHFNARLAQTSSFPVGTTTILNTAIASITGATATTNQTTVTVTRQQDSVVTFGLVKQVANFSNGDNVWKDQLSGSAAPGDTVAFKLTLTNTGNTPATNVLLKDVLPAGMSYVPGSSILYNATSGNSGTPIADGVTASGYTFANIVNGTPGQQIIVFHAKLTDQCTGTQTLVNNAQAIWNGSVRAQDSATVIYACTRGMILQKQIRTTATNNEFRHDGGIVSEGSIMSYRITVSNNGNVTVNSPVLKDILPKNVSYVANSLRIDGEVMSQIVQTGFFNQGMILTNFVPGMTKFITFDVKVSDCPDLGDTVLTNTANLSADGIATLTDTAIATVRVNPIANF